MKIATFGGGCFWCTEAVFQQLKGIERVVSGYSGGNALGKPTYRKICSGLTGHAEVIQVIFDEKVISFHEILVVFMTTHNPTILNRQGADRGTQYRSVIFYHSKEQQKIARTVVDEISSFYEDSIVTEISPLKIFYEAEKDHQDYYKNNSDNRYCNFVINPKLAKLRTLYADKLR